MDYLFLGMLRLRKVISEGTYGVDTDSAVTYK